ncbi:MAG TPA: hypothetical protein VKZ61_01865 [Thermomicrobiales bacterium]|jgi:hypothetical protein|nr:hypothetical protein [Thermomicrobiales bacterium]
MVHQYMISSVVLEEHRQKVERFAPDPDWPPAVAVERTLLRLRLGRALRAVADRLDPTGARVESARLLVMPYPDDAVNKGSRTRRV